MALFEAATGLRQLSKGSVDSDIGVVGGEGDFFFSVEGGFALFGVCGCAHSANTAIYTAMKRMVRDRAKKKRKEKGYESGWVC